MSPSSLTSASTHDLAQELQAASARLLDALDQVEADDVAGRDDLSSLCDEAEAIAGIADQIGEAMTGDSSGLRILVVDDTEVNRTVLASQLSRFELDADTCTNGREALVALATVAYDLVLMDWHMPEIDGLQALVMHRADCLAEDREPTPIVMVTADASPESRRRCLEAGAADFLAKPVSLEMLRGCLVEILGADALAAAAGTSKAPAAKPGPVDRSVIDQMVDDLGGGEPVQMVIDAFIADADERLAAVRDGVRGSDTAEARRASHTLKSTAAMLGAREVSSLAKRFEQAFDADSPPTEPELTAFELVLSAALDDLRHVRESLSDA